MALFAQDCFNLMSGGCRQCTGASGRGICLYAKSFSNQSCVSSAMVSSWAEQSNHVDLMSDGRSPAATNGRGVSCPHVFFSPRNGVFNLKRSHRKQKNRRTCEKNGPRLLQPDVRWMPTDQGNRQRHLLFAC